MARNSEKAQSMLFRFREAHLDSLGLIRKHRPSNVDECTTLKDAEKWRYEVISELAQKIGKIQDVALTEYQVRDLNDNLNKLIRTKAAWEYRIKALGGPDYRGIGNRLMDEGRQVPGDRGGYRYFGRARDLPGVKELFMVALQDTAGEVARHELNKRIDADYYGYRDEDDGVLLAQEMIYEKAHGIKVVELSNSEDIHCQIRPAIPGPAQVESFLVSRRKKILMDQYILDYGK